MVITCLWQIYPIFGLPFVLDLLSVVTNFSAIHITPISMNTLHFYQELYPTLGLPEFRQSWLTFFSSCADDTSVFVQMLIPLKLCSRGRIFDGHTQQCSQNYATRHNQWNESVGTWHVYIADPLWCLERLIKKMGCKRTLNMCEYPLSAH